MKVTLPTNMEYVTLILSQINALMQFPLKGIWEGGLKVENSVTYDTQFIIITSSFTLLLDPGTE